MAASPSTCRAGTTAEAAGQPSPGTWSWKLGSVGGPGGGHSAGSWLRSHPLESGFFLPTPAHQVSSRAVVFPNNTHAPLSYCQKGWTEMMGMGGVGKKVGIEFFWTPKG